MFPKSVLETNQENVNKPIFWKSLPAGENWKSKSMRKIPEEFVRSTPEDFEYRIVFSVGWGNSWMFFTEREKDGLFMIKEDWNEFVDDNDLGPNDTLSITHEHTWFLNARIFKNGREVLDVPYEAESEAKPRNNQSLKFHQDITTTASSSANGKANGRAKGRRAAGDPVRYLSNPKNPYFVRTLVRRNDVLYVNQTTIHKFGLEFGPVDSPMTYIVPSGEVEAFNRLYSGNRCFSGWAGVCRQNNWIEGDSLVCEFELSQGVVKALRVHLMN